MGEFNVWLILTCPNVLLLFYICLELSDLRLSFERKIEAIDKDICYYKEQVKEMKNKIELLIKKDFTENDLLYNVSKRLSKESFKDLRRMIESEKDYHKYLSDMFLTNDSEGVRSIRNV